jgi:MIP family channel proteins
LAEAIGTYVLVFAGCGAIGVNELQAGRITHVGVALCFGLAVGVMIAAFGPVSGAHFNPAVTLALAAGRHFPAQQILPYWLAQLSGALLAALTLRGLLGATTTLGVTQPAGSAGQTLALEMVLTAILVLVITSMALNPRANAALAAPAIGGTITLEALFAGPISGASMNPARSLAPALVSGQWQHVWIYVTAPLIGGLVGMVMYQLLRRFDREPES